MPNTRGIIKLGILLIMPSCQNTELEKNNHSISNGNDHLPGLFHQPPAGLAAR